MKFLYFQFNPTRKLNISICCLILQYYKIYYDQNGNVSSSIRNIPPTKLPTYTAISDLRQLFLIVMLRQFLGRALRLGQTRGPALRPQVHIAAAIPRTSRSDV